jgi:hypothetical protein
MFPYVMGYYNVSEANSSLRLVWQLIKLFSQMNLLIVYVQQLPIPNML